MPLANSFKKEPQKNEFSFPLIAAICNSCWLFQIIEQPKPELMFNENYPFFTGLSKYMNIHFEKYSKFVESFFREKIGKRRILEIGYNDGTLLEKLNSEKFLQVGIDPSKNVLEKIQNNKIEKHLGFFDKSNGERLLSQYGKFDAIIAANVICHISDINELFETVFSLLNDEGVFIFEEPYLLSMLKKVSYDQIYDEHVFIFSLLSVENLARRHSFHLIDFRETDTHGGSARYVLTKSLERTVTNNVRLQKDLEIKSRLDALQTYQKFATECEKNKILLYNYLCELKSQGKKVYGYAATSKSTTILNYCNIGADLIISIGDSTPEKQGTVTPGSIIPIISIEELRESNPDYVILFAWNHKNEILEKESNTMLSKAKWINIVPSLYVEEI